MGLLIFLAVNLLVGHYCWRQFPLRDPDDKVRRYWIAEYRERPAKVVVMILPCLAVQLICWVLLTGDDHRWIVSFSLDDVVGWHVGLLIGIFCLWLSRNRGPKQSQS